MKTALILLSILLCPLELMAEPSSPLLFTDMEGTEHSVPEILETGQNVVLVFWQTWCANCRREAPGLVEASKAHEGKLSFFGVVSGSDRDVNDRKVRRYIEQYQLPYPQIRDRELSLVKLYEVTATPTIVVLGPHEEILYRGNHPPDDWSEFDGKAGPH